MRRTSRLRFTIVFDEPHWSRSLHQYILSSSFAGTGQRRDVKPHQTKSRLAFAEDQRPYIAIVRRTCSKSGRANRSSIFSFSASQRSRPSAMDSLVRNFAENSYQRSRGKPTSHIRKRSILQRGAILVPLGGRQDRASARIRGHKGLHVSLDGQLRPDVVRHSPRARSPRRLTCRAPQLVSPANSPCFL